VCFVNLHSLQDHLGTGTCDLDHPIFIGAKKNTDNDVEDAEAEENTAT
jgi:hypothetical protein